MGLNIKNERTHQLVRQLAELTGTSQTSAVEDAVRRRLQQLRADDDHVAVEVQEILVLADEFAAHLTADQREALSHADDELYDDAGLPR